MSKVLNVSGYLRRIDLVPCRACKRLLADARGPAASYSSVWRCRACGASTFVPSGESMAPHRITWPAALGGAPHVQALPPYSRENHAAPLWDRDGVLLRVATEADMRAMYEGRGIAHDPATDPNSAAWREHVARGGD